MGKGGGGGAVYQTLALYSVAVWVAYPYPHCIPLDMYYSLYGVVWCV